MGYFAVSPPPPEAFDRAMVFIDGSNLLPRLRDAKLQVPSFFQLAASICGRKRLSRVYFYTTQSKVERVAAEHGPSALEKCRVVLGDSVTLDDGTIREKGVDALLVADLVYHAASRNCSFAAVLSNDTDFAVALKRVEDFGCNTGVLAVVREASPRLSSACDEYLFLSASDLVTRRLAVEPSAA
jgi:uncharacterized LabA/DUF88 family protein